MSVHETEFLETIHNQGTEKVVSVMENAENIVTGLIEIDEYINSLEGVSPATQTNLKLMALLATHLYLTKNTIEVIQKAFENERKSAIQQYQRGEIQEQQLEIVNESPFDVNPENPNDVKPNAKGKKILQNYLLRNLRKYLDFDSITAESNEPIYPTIGHELEIDSGLQEDSLRDAIMYDDIWELVKKIGLTSAVAVTSKAFPYKATKDVGNTLEFIFNPTLDSKAQMRIAFIINSLIQINYGSGANFHETIAGISLDLENPEILKLKPMWLALGYEPENEQKLNLTPPEERYFKYSKLRDGKYVYIPFHRSRDKEIYQPLNGETSKPMVEMRSNPALIDARSILAQARKVDFDFCASACIQAVQGMSKLPNEKVQKLALEWKKLEMSFDELNQEFDGSRFPDIEEIVTPLLSVPGLIKFLEKIDDPQKQERFKNLLAEIIQNKTGDFPSEIVEAAMTLNQVEMGTNKSENNRISTEDMHNPTLENGQPIFSPESYFTYLLIISNNTIYSRFLKICETNSIQEPNYKARWRKAVILFKKKVKDIIHDKDQPI